jgi:hypothetical protein
MNQMGFNFPYLLPDKNSHDPAEDRNNRAFHAAIMCQLSVQLPSSATAQAP